MLTVQARRLNSRLLALTKLRVIAAVLAATCAAATARADGPLRYILVDASAKAESHRKYSETANSLDIVLPDWAEYWEVTAGAQSEISDSTSVSSSSYASDTHGAYGSYGARGWGASTEVIPFTVTQTGTLSIPLHLDATLHGGGSVTLYCSWHRADDYRTSGYGDLGEPLDFYLRNIGGIFDAAGVPDGLTVVVDGDTATLSGQMQVDLDVTELGEHFLRFSSSANAAAGKVGEPGPNVYSDGSASLSFGGFFWDELSGSTAHLHDTRYPSRSYVPEPASLALLALGGLALIRRRKRE